MLFTCRVREDAPRPWSEGGACSLPWSEGAHSDESSRKWNPIDHVKMVHSHAVAGRSNVPGPLPVAYFRPKHHICIRQHRPWHPEHAAIQARVPLLTSCAPNEFVCGFHRFGPCDIGPPNHPCEARLGGGVPTHGLTRLTIHMADTCGGSHDRSLGRHPHHVVAIEYMPRCGQQRPLAHQAGPRSSGAADWRPRPASQSKLKGSLCGGAPQPPPARRPSASAEMLVPPTPRHHRSWLRDAHPHGSGASGKVRSEDIQKAGRHLSRRRPPWRQGKHSCL